MDEELKGWLVKSVGVVILGMILIMAIPLWFAVFRHLPTPAEIDLGLENYCIETYGLNLTFEELDINGGNHKIKCGNIAIKVIYEVKPTCLSKDEWGDCLGSKENELIFKEINTTSR